MSILDGITQKDVNSIRRRAYQFSRLGDPEDLAQDAFLKALENQHKFKGDSSVTTYVHGFVKRIASNVVSVENGKQGRKGRKQLRSEYAYELKRLHSFHGRRVGVAE